MYDNIGLALALGDGERARRPSLAMGEVVQRGRMAFFMRAAVLC